jgi:hypothetical protein
MEHTTDIEPCQHCTSRHRQGMPDQTNLSRLCWLGFILVILQKKSPRAINYHYTGWRSELPAAPALSAPVPPGGPYVADLTG